MKSTNGNTKDPKPVISIDIGNPRVNKSEGERLFTEDGNPSEFTHQIMKILESIHLGYEDNSKFIKQTHSTRPIGVFHIRGYVY